MENRESERFPLACDAFCILHISGKKQGTVGRTVNISRSGVLLDLPGGRALEHVGIELSIAWPCPPGTTLKMTGEIVRCEPTGRAAVRLNEHYEFVRPQDEPQAAPKLSVVPIAAAARAGTK